MKSCVNVVYEDNHLIVVSKPAGLLTQPSGSGEISLEDQVKDYIKEKYHKPGAVFLHAIHRIDRPVSGLVIFARTSKALSRLQESIRQGRMKKTYLAQLEGSLPNDEGTLEHRLVHGDHRAYVAPEGQLSRLHYRKREDGLVEIDLETGRYHQIRAQMAAVHCPIVGDTKYGSQKDLNGVIRLHHFRCEIDHPITQIRLAFEDVCSEMFIKR